MSKKIWFGKPGAFQYLPCPAAGIDVASQRYSETLEFQNGGASIVRSAARHRIFDFDFPVQDASGSGGLDVYSDYSDGVYGDGPWYFSDPMTHDQNVLPPSISVPNLTFMGWPQWLPRDVSSGFTVPAFQNRPTSVVRSSWSPATPAQRVSKIIVPKPRDHSLEFGFVGEISNSVNLIYREGNPDGTAGPDKSFALIYYTDPTNFNVTVGPGFDFVEIEISEDPGFPGVISLQCAMARIIPPAGAAASDPLFITGHGSSAVEFDGQAVVENYVMTQRHLKGMSFQMREVGLWR